MTTASRPYYPALDELRGIAILLVVLGHIFIYISPHMLFIASRGVDLFFVLSGFLITDILLHTKFNNDYFRHFYLRRTLRIFPLYYLVVGLFFLIPPVDSEFLKGYQYYSNHWAWIVFHLNNILPIINERPDAPLMLSHFWSLSVEEQYYLVWPFVIFLFPANRKLIVFVISVIALCIISRFMIWHFMETGYPKYYLINTFRIDFLAMGGLLAILRFVYPENYLKRFAIISIAFFSVHFIGYFLDLLGIYEFPHFPILGYSSVACIFTLAVSFSIRSTEPHKNWFSEILRFFGRISYGLYIYHFPIYYITIYCIIPPSQKNGVPESLIASFIAVLISIGISIVSYNWFERVILKKSHRLRF